MYRRSKICAEPDGLRELMPLTGWKHFTPQLLHVLRVSQLKALECGLLTLWQMLLLAITSKEFISTLVVCIKYIRGLTTSLQEEAKDIVQAVSVMNTLTSYLERESILTMTSGLILSWKCAVRWGLYHQFPGYVVVSAIEQILQQPIHLSTKKDHHHSNIGPDRRFSTHLKIGLSVLVTEDLETVQCGDESRRYNISSKRVLPR